MPLTNAERTKLAHAIMKEATKLYQYRDELKDKNTVRQQAIDNDMGMIYEHLQTINRLTGVDSEWLNNVR